MLLRTFVLGVVLGCAAAVMPGCGKSVPACGPSTCASCCNTSGQCVLAPSALSCGASGNMCAQCQNGQQCIQGTCMGNANFGGGTATGGGDGGSAGGGAATGGSGVGGGGGGGGALPEWFQQAYAKASNTGASDSFG